MKNKAMDASCSRRDFCSCFGPRRTCRMRQQSSAESKNGRVYYLNKKAEEQST
mgnify:CR=1 FL=1